MESVKPAAPPEAILQLKVRLLGISPMIWRRVLVPESVSLRELHGVVQLAMGWEGIHLFEFAVRGVRYTGPDLSGASTDVALSDLRFRRNAKFRYVYDMFCEWEHGLRVEERLPADAGERYPRCIGGAGAWPASHLVSLARIQGPAGRAAPAAVVVAPPAPSICHNEVTISGDPTVPRGRPYSRHDDLAIIEACMPKTQRNLSTTLRQRRLGFTEQAVGS